MYGFVFALLVVGGLGTLVAFADPQNARLAPYIGLTALFAGLGAIVLSALFAFIGYQLPGSETTAFAGLLGGYAVGGVGGAAFGFAHAHRRRDESDASD